MSADQRQYQLHSLPVRLAGRNGSFTDGRTIAAACRPVASTSVSREFDPPVEERIGLNLFQNKPAGAQVSVSDHLAWSPAGEEQPRRMESLSEIIFCSETDNADVV